ncbi:PREDICTED: uncharacterized protein LOC106789660 [Polistes canadensis]|uniref:uncharacterized protein LOC106789660 n=1 Tax=Polistes canadensis TaxID=91411 RepID=UPI0007190687|nr:PREDICTED: uncharacterized protein LOC106789660 [Polistes canadensis]XP_014609679.1 PREDICTED: uncharacterized protein LOC106789660 [Polistes canadensis]
MEEIESLRGLLQKRRNICCEKYKNDKEQQSEEYKNLMNQLKALRDESMDCQEIISKNCNYLITHENAVKKLLFESKHAQGLPISHECHRQSVEFFSNALEFLNNFQAANGPLEIIQNDNIDAEKIINNIVTCTNHVSNEFYKAKSAFLHIEQVRNNIDLLCNLEIISDDENAELNSSDS